MLGFTQPYKASRVKLLLVLEIIIILYIIIFLCFNIILVELIKQFSTKVIIK